LISGRSLQRTTTPDDFIKIYEIGEKTARYFLPDSQINGGTNPQIGDNPVIGAKSIDFCKVSFAGFIDRGSQFIGHCQIVDNYSRIQFIDSFKAGRGIP
jgi:hypothetical protein